MILIADTTKITDNFTFLYLIKKTFLTLTLCMPEGDEKSMTAIWLHIISYNFNIR